MRLPGGWELIIVLVVVVLIFGVGKVADIGPALGKTISGFRKAVKEEEEEEVEEEKKEIEETEPSEKTE